jgi:hypothetical protein
MLTWRPNTGLLSLSIRLEKGGRPTIFPISPSPVYRIMDFFTASERLRMKVEVNEKPGKEAKRE